MSDGFLTPLPSRGAVSVTGPDAETFLQGLLSNDVRRAAPGAAVWAALLTPQGKFLFDMFVVRTAEGFLLETHRAWAGPLAAKLRFYKLRAKVEIADASENWQVFAAWGPNAEGLNAAGPNAAAHGFPDPRLAALGYRALVPAGAAPPPGVAAATEAAWHLHRLSLGVPDSVTDVPQEQAFLMDSGFDELHGIDFRKGCYVGQELTARMKHRGTAKKRLLPVQFDGDTPPSGTPISDGDTEIGTVMGGLGARAMASIRLDRMAEAEAAGRPLTAQGRALTVERPGWFATGPAPGA